MKPALKNVAILTILLNAVCVANLAAQSVGRDLPRDFRSLAGVTLNQDSAASIRAKLGRTRARRMGSGHDVYTGWCYVPSRSPHALLELMSDASDLGSPNQTLNVIRLRADAARADREGCAELPGSAVLASPAGLRLGLSRADIARLLGAPTRRAADSLIYTFDAKEYMRPGTPEYAHWNTQEYRESCFDAGPPYANVGATVTVLLRDGRAAEIRIERYDQSVC